MQSDVREMILKGISGSPGICIGKAYLVDKEGVDVIEKYSISPEAVRKEVDRFKTAVTKARNELEDTIKRVPEELRHHAAILETHLLLHKDKMFYGKIIDMIKIRMINAEWALKETTAQTKAMFNDISDPYLKSRAADIEHVAERIMGNLVGIKAVNIAGIDKRVILVAHNLSPAQTSQIQLEKVMGFITDRGGRASHTSIIARTLEIPAVLGLDNATSIIKNDNIIIVDGTAGIVIVHPEEETLIRYDELAKKYAQRKADILRTSVRPAESIDGQAFSIMGNIELPEEVVAVKDHGGDGIGLYRTEFLYMNRDTFPDEQELFNQYKEVAELMYPQPVTIRTLDVNGDKAILGMETPDEANPALGLRAIRFCLQKPGMFKTQFRAILRAAAFGNVRVLLPMISGSEEIHETLKIIDQAAESLEKDGFPYNRNIKTGIMIEVPSAAIIADQLADMVDFFSIGTNDLVQYTLAIDRGNRQVAYLYNTLHPAVIRMIKFVVDAGKKKQIKTFMCGEMAAEIFNLPILMGIGIDALSMAPQSIPSVKNMIRKISVSESRLFLKEVLKQTSAADTMQLITDTYGKTLTNGIYHT